MPSVPSPLNVFHLPSGGLNPWGSLFLLMVAVIGSTGLVILLVCIIDCVERFPKWIANRPPPESDE